MAKHRILGAMKREQCALALAEKELYETPGEQRKDMFRKLEDSLIISHGGEEQWEGMDLIIRQRNIEEMENVLKNIVAGKQLEDRL